MLGGGGDGTHAGSRDGTGEPKFPARRLEARGWRPPTGGRLAVGVSWPWSTRRVAPDRPHNSPWRLPADSLPFQTVRHLANDLRRRGTCAMSTFSAIGTCCASCTILVVIGRIADVSFHPLMPPGLENTP